VFLSLHGAGVVEGIEPRGDLCAAIRTVIGAAVPMTAVFDLHGSVTQPMADALNGVFACHQYRTSTCICARRRPSGSSCACARRD
jgi:microcystin degradation protein MlrC